MKVLGLAVDGRKLTFSHGGKDKSSVLNQLDIHVQRGIIYGLLGPSGCGKTTLLKCILGRFRPKSGEILIYGRKPGEPGFGVPGKCVGYMPQDLALSIEITIEETLWYYGRLAHMTNVQIDDQISFLLDLLKMTNKKSLVKNLSGGQKRRVSFAAALIHKPPLLILDEPTVGVDPVLRQNIWNYLTTLSRKDSMTIIITTHYVEEARQAHTVGLMREGRLLAEMNPEKLIEAHGVQTLEEVFLKLSIADVQWQSQVAASMETLSTVINESVSHSYRSLSSIHEEEPQNTLETGVFNVSSDGSEGNDLSKNGISHLRLEDYADAMMRHTDTVSERWKKCASRIGTLMRKSFVQMRRNIPLTLFQLFVPALQCLLYCLVVGRNLVDMPMALVNLDTENGLSQTFLENLKGETIKQIPFSNLSLALDSVKSGETWGVIYIGPNFTNGLMERFLVGSDVTNETIRASSVKLYLDMTNQQVTFFLRSAIAISFQKFAEHMLRITNQNPLLAKSLVLLEDPVYGSEDTTFTSFMLPNMVIGITFFTAVGLTAMAIIVEQRDGLIERAMITGVTFGEILFAFLFSMFIIMVGQVFLELLIVLLIFRVAVLGSLGGVVFCVLLAGVCGMSFGLLISSVCSSEYMAVLISMAIYTPNFILSGIIWPIESMSYYMRLFAYFLPLTLLAQSNRSILSRGWGILDHHTWDGPAVAVAWIFLPLILSAICFKYKH